MTEYEHYLRRIDHDALPDPPSVKDVPSNVAMVLFLLALPVVFVWIVMAEAWKLVTRWR